MDAFWQYIAKWTSASAVYSFRKYLRYRQTQTSSCNAGNMQLRLGLHRRDSFFDL